MFITSQRKQKFFKYIAWSKALIDHLHISDFDFKIIGFTGVIPL